MQVVGPDSRMQMNFLQLQCFEDAPLRWSGQSGMAALKAQGKEVQESILEVRFKQKY